MEIDDKAPDLHIPALGFGPVMKYRDKVENWSTAHLLAGLERICLRIQEEGGVARAYTRNNRLIYLGINIRLNELSVMRGQYVPAPAFRKRLPRTMYPEGRERQLSNDTQVLDLHYFWLNGHTTCRDPRGAKALNGKVFDFESAHLFAKNRGKVKDKLKSLGLGVEPGKNLCRLGATVLRTKEDKSIQEHAKDSNDTNANSLASRCIAHRANKELWAPLLTADQILHKLGRDTSNGQLAQLVTIITGQPLGPEHRLKDKLSTAKRALS